MPETDPRKEIVIHAENQYMQAAIEEAIVGITSRHGGPFGCELYSTGEPCPMCLCACLWANIDKVYYGCTVNDNEIIGFRDEDFDERFGGRETFSDYLVCIDREACLKLFDAYLDMERTSY